MVSGDFRACHFLPPILKAGSFNGEPNAHKDSSALWTFSAAQMSRRVARSSGSLAGALPGLSLHVQHARDMAL
jgi:hypothetical protein